MASYPAPNSDYFKGANYNNAFFKTNTSGISYAYATKQFLARIGNPSSIATSTSFSGNITSTGAIACNGRLTTSSPQDSTSPTTGAIHGDGGLGIVKNAYIGGTITSDGLITTYAGLNNTSSSAIASLGDIYTYASGAITSAGILTAQNGISNTGTIVSTGAVSAPPTYVQNSLSFTATWYIQYSSATLASYTQLNVPVSAGGATTTTPIGVAITPISTNPVIMLNFLIPFYTTAGGVVSLIFQRSTVSLLSGNVVCNANFNYLTSFNNLSGITSTNIMFIDTPTVTIGQTLYYTIWAKTVGAIASNFTIQSSNNINGFINCIAQQLN